MFDVIKHNVPDNVASLFTLRGSPANSGPVDFVSEKKFPFKLCTLKGFGI